MRWPTAPRPWPSAADGGAEVPLIARVSHSAWPDLHGGGHLRRSLGRRRGVRARGQCEPGDRRRGADRFGCRGDVVGVANFYQGNELVASRDLIASRGFAGPGFLEGIGIWWNRLWGNDAPAPTEVVNEMPSSTASHPLARIISPLRPSPQASQTTLPPTVPQAARARVPQTPPTSREVGHERALPRLFPRDFTERHRVPPADSSCSAPRRPCSRSS
ncbi:MAG: hypothetical protein ACLTDR_01065 [Adlercreutzia equolifaciens]